MRYQHIVSGRDIGIANQLSQLATRQLDVLAADATPAE